MTSKQKIFLAFYLISTFFSTATLSYYALKNVHKTYIDRSPAILETRAIVAVVDTGIDLNEPKLRPYICNGAGYDFTGYGMQDTIGHGTNVTWNIMKGLDPSRYCAMPLKYYTSFGANNLLNEVAAFDYAINHHAILINLSGGGDIPSNKEADEVLLALSKGITVVVAAGNNGSDLDQVPYYPACSTTHKNFHVVGSTDDVGNRSPTSNYGRRVTDWAVGLNVYGPDGIHFMSGTSQATANASNRLLKEMR